MYNPYIMRELFLREVDSLRGWKCLFGSVRLTGAATSLPACCRAVGLASDSSSLRPQQTQEWPQKRVPAIPCIIWKGNNKHLTIWQLIKEPGSFMNAPFVSIAKPGSKKMLGMTYIVDYSHTNYNNIQIYFSQGQELFQSTHLHVLSNHNINRINLWGSLLLCTFSMVLITKCKYTVTSVTSVQYPLSFQKGYIPIVPCNNDFPFF